MTPESKRKFIKSSAWFHTIDVGDGIHTPGMEDIRGTLDRVHLPHDMTGMTVLDVGANDGFYSFDCERRGAERVVALDKWDRKYDNTWAVENIRFAKKCRGSKIEIVQKGIAQYAAKCEDRFDIVLFMGVLYHLKNMMAGVESCARMVKPGGLLITETHYVKNGGGPMAVYYPGDALNNDPTNFWGPNDLCVRAMLGEYFDDTAVMGTKDDRIAYHSKGVKA